MTTISIEYFAILREHVGQSSEELQTTAKTVGDLYNELNQRYAFPDMGRLKVAVNHEFGEWNTPLADGDSVVFIPPVAGG